MRKHKRVKYPLEYTVALFLGRELMEKDNYDYKKKFDVLTKKVKIFFKDQDSVYNNCFYPDLEMLDYSNKIYNSLVILKTSKDEALKKEIEDFFDFLWNTNFKRKLDKILMVKKIRRTKIELFQLIFNEKIKIEEYYEYLSKRIEYKDSSKDEVMIMGYFYWMINKKEDYNLKESEFNDKAIELIKKFLVTYLSEVENSRKIIMVDEGEEIKERICKYLNLDEYFPLEELYDFVKMSLYLNDTEKEFRKINKKPSLPTKNIKMFENLKKEYDVIDSMFKHENLEFDFLINESEEYKNKIIEILNTYYVKKESRNRQEIVEKLPYMITIKLLIDLITKNNDYHKKFKKPNCKTVEKERHYIKELEKNIQIEQDKNKKLKDKLISNKDKIEEVRKKEEGKILELSREINSKNEKIKEKDKLIEEQKEELKVLREELFSENRWYQDEEIKDEKEYVIPEKDVLIIGGHPQWQHKLKEKLPSSYSFIEAETTQNITSNLKYVDWVFYDTNYVSHQLYYMTKDYCKIHGIKIGYIKHRNIEKVIQNMAKKISQK